MALDRLSLYRYSNMIISKHKAKKIAVVAFQLVGITLGSVFILLLALIFLLNIIDPNAMRH